MIWYEAEVEALEAARPADAPRDAVVFYGSSSIRLWHGLANDLRPAFGDAPVVNLGFGGSTLQACAFFFERLVLPLRPASLVVYAGDNDLGDGQTPDDVVGSYRRLRQQVDRHLGPIPFGFIAIKPSPARWRLLDHIRRANACMEADIAGRPNGRFIDVFDPMLGRDGGPRPELFEDDGLHLSPEGYRLWTRVITEHAPSLAPRPGTAAARP